MTEPLAALLDGLGAACGRSLRAEEVLRLDVGRDGALVASLELDGCPRWLERRGAGWAALEPAADARLPLAGRLGGQDAALLAWRPGRRMALRVQEDGRSLVLKGYRARRSAAAAAAHRAAQAASAGSGLVAPELCAHDEALETLAFEDLGGERLELGPRAPAYLYRVGDALRRVQERERAAELPAHERARELAVLDEWRARVEGVLGAAPEGWEAARETLEAYATAGAGRAAVLVHRDLHDGQLLATARGLAWIDFDLASLGEDALDAGNLTAHLYLRALQGLYGATQARADAASDALLDGLDRGEEPGFMQSLRFHQTSAFLRLALVYSLRPRWRHVVPQLTTLARRCAEELPHA